MKGYGSTMRPKGDGSGGAKNANGPGDYGFKSGSKIGDTSAPATDYEGCCDALSGQAKGNVPTPEGS